MLNPFLSSLQQPDILVHCRPTHPANHSQITDIQHPLPIRRIMPQKYAGQILNRNLRPSNPLPHGPSFFMPDRTRIRIIDSSNWLNTPAICGNASLIGSGCPLRQSKVILPSSLWFDRLYSGGLFRGYGWMVPWDCCKDKFMEYVWCGK